MRRRTFLLALFAGVVVATAPAAAQNFERARAAIQEQIKERGVPSIAVAAARDGKIVWAEGFGWADRERQIAATEHTLYSLASISKPITATGVMVLVERKQIELDKPVNDYLGAAKLRARVGDAAEATVRRVANHTAGLGLHYQFFYEDEPYARPSMDETIRRYGHLFYAPGERYQYSNLGYGILDSIIERVSGASFADFMHAEVFAPLGLERMSVGPLPQFADETAVRYNRQGKPLPFYDFDHRGGSAVFSSAHDLVRFGMFHLKLRLSGQKRILSDAAIDEMQRPGMGNYGIGWSVVRPQGFRVVTHSGGMPGVTTTLVLVPSENIALAVLANTSGAPLDGVVQEILRALVPRLPPPPARPSQSEREFKPAGELVGEWRGVIDTYQGPRPLVLRIERPGSASAQLGDAPWTPLHQAAIDDGWLVGRFSGDLATDDASRRPHIIQLTLKLRGEALNGSGSAISIPGPRGGNAQTHWVELKRRGAANHKE